MNRSILAVALASLVLLAGCASGVPSGIDGSGSPTGTASTNEMGSVDFYVSDEPNAIDDFEHLNVTITAVAFHEANASADGDDDVEADDDDVETDDDANETVTETTTTTTDNETTTTTNETETTTTDNDNETTTTVVSGEVGDKTESDEWVVKEVDDQTVDLTRLKGANATLLSQFDVPAGEYDVAMVYVSDVNATLTTGEQVNVKLPSEKLHVNKAFTVGANESIDFVFDITVVKAGNSGKYILKPIVTESGPDVEKNVVDRDGKPIDAGPGDDDAEFNVTVEGNVSAGENVTITVTNATGDPVVGASVAVNDEVVGETNADGQFSFTVPEDEELEIEVESEDGEGELELELAADADDTADGKNGGEHGDDQSDRDDGDELELAAAFTGDVEVGENATIVVTDGDDNPVENATVDVNGAVVGETNADGELTFEVPDDDEIEVVVTKGDAEVTLEQDIVAAATA